MHRPSRAPHASRRSLATMRVALVALALPCALVSAQAPAPATRAIKSAYGDHAYKVAISSPKSMIGHLVGAAGIASALAALGAIRDQVLPPTINLNTPDPECDLDYVPLVKRAARIDTVAIDGFGFGGQNAVAIFRRITDA